ncbi:MAG: OmpH family outer membrane protein [Nitrospirae bacterium]|nr:OmpH family outer membrane protein [Nitrospirota bacterium]
MKTRTVCDMIHLRPTRSRLLWVAAAVAVTLTVGGCAASSSTRPTAQVGVIDFQQILEEADAGKKLRESLNTFMKNRQALIELEEKELKRMEDDLIKQDSVLSANAKKERQEQFRRRAMEFQQKANELNREVQEKQQEMLEGFRGKVEKVTAKVAQQLGLQVVIQKGKGSFTFYNDASLDISVRVIEEFNKGTP